MKNPPVIVWFRQDLRIHDNPAFFYAAKTKAPLLLVYILDTKTKQWQPGAASRWWLHHSLDALSKELSQKYQAKLILTMGNPAQIIPSLVKEHQATAVYWNRCYEPQAILRDQEIKQDLMNKKIEVHSFNGALLKEPWEVLNKSKQPFKVFTPFWKALQQHIMREILPAPAQFISVKAQSLNLEAYHLLPTLPWDNGLKENWVPGEVAAKNHLKQFLTKHVKDYKVLRDYPKLRATSRLSPHLHFGEISPIQIWHAAMAFKDKNASLQTDIMHFLSEIAWREFSNYLLYYFPELPDKAYQTAFNHFPWEINKKYLSAWQKGLTGYPIVDAGMRELWHTGWMHNRVRMIVASFLIKHLLQPWQSGEAWFWDTLVDADLANNAASWQWVAGSGADAAPYFRIFNPIIQGEKFDKDGEYVKQWVPELKQLEAKFVHKPWEAPDNVLKQAGIRLGQDYPLPIVNHESARKKALAAYKKLPKITTKKRPNQG
ncbi:MAG: deoxyribodipyrimidine photo-lyase [Proteobacteria bacterium]|nr:deoxyribodipyrimidine photo-lyase [Pseudomonadota bacterium]